MAAKKPAAKKPNPFVKGKKGVNPFAKKTGKTVKCPKCGASVPC